MLQIKEDDELPHKICFRCSAKVEELHDFVQKCIKSQENLEQALGKKGTIVLKPAPIKKKWEDSLNKSYISNDDICDAVIQRAMERIRDINPKTKSILNISKDEKTEINKIGDEFNKSKSTDNVEESKNIQFNDTLSKSDVSKNTRKCKNKTKNEETNSNNPKDSNTEKNVTKTTEFKLNPEQPEEIKKPGFNIMQHVSTIKVNGVGTLFQCGICNRNFLSKDVVMTHGCAKNGIPKTDFTKYIKTSVDTKVNSPIPNVKYITQVKPNDQNTVSNNNELSTSIKQKPGPASKKVNLRTDDNEVIKSKTISDNVDNLPHSLFNKVIQLMPGPNNTFSIAGTTGNSFNQDSVIIKKVDKNVANTELTAVLESNKRQLIGSAVNKSPVYIIDDDDECSKQIGTQKFIPENQPYPVGLFSTVPRNEEISAPDTFTALTMKKHSYTVVQTGNPSKLLISSKPQIAEPPVIESNKSKRGRKKLQKNQSVESVKNQSSEDHASESAYNDRLFNFVNVDPSLQPSYVLPTDNTIQISRVTTSTPAQSNNAKSIKTSGYICNICDITFSREKKLQAHIQAHLNELDEEDGKIPKKRSRKF